MRNDLPALVSSLSFSTIKMIPRTTSRKLVQVGKTGLHVAEKGLQAYHVARGVAAAGNAIASAAMPYIGTAAAVAL